MSGLKDPREILFSTQKEMGNFSNREDANDMMNMINQQQQLSKEEDINSSYVQSDRRTSNKNDLVQKLLNERKQNRSRTNNIYSSQSQQQESQTSQNPSLQQQQIMQQQQQQNNSMLGGYNPESLYQDDVQSEITNHQQQTPYQDQQQQQFQQHQFSMQQRPQDLRSNQTGQFNVQSIQSSNQMPLNGGDGADNKYRDAVEYAKAQIQKEMQRKNDMNYNQDIMSSNASEQKPVHLQNRHYEMTQKFSQQDQDEQDQFQRRTQQNSLGYGTMQFMGGNGILPPNVMSIDRQLAAHSTQKTKAEMNQKTQPITSSKHNFQQMREESDNQGFQQEKKKFNRPSSANPGEYMKNTISADLKKGPQATTNKSKNLLVEIEKKQKEECTFKPQIKDYQVAPSKELSKEERWKKLTEPKTTEIQKRERIRMQQQIEETQKACPFKPQTTKHSKSARKDGFEKENEMNLEERLLHEADLRKEKREKLKRDLDMEQMKECSFKPRLLQNSNSVINVKKFNSQAPIHERVGDLQKEKNEKLQKLRVQSELECQDLTFKPVVNKKSEKISQVKRAEEDSRPHDVVDRLYQDANDRIQKQMHFSESVNEQLNRDHPFQPQISKTSNYMSEKSDMFNGNLKDFYDRQQAFQEKQIEKREYNKNQYSEAAKCTFKPEINVTSEIIMESDPKRGNETDEDKYMRLYKKDQKKQEVVKEMIEKEVYQQYTFKPQINKISKTLAKNTTIDDLAYNKKGQEKRDKIQEEMQQQEVAECTFKPQTTKTKKYQEIAPTYDLTKDPSGQEFSKKLKEQLKEKQERIAQERREREYDQMKDCTFKPQILDTAPATLKDEIVVVRGLGRHLELKELQKKKEEEKRLREAEVFGLNHKFSVQASELDITNPNRSQIIGKLNATQQSQYTVPQPFQLSNNNQDKKNKLMQQIKEKEMTECTFKPQTNEGRNRQLIQEILEDAEKENQQDDVNVRYQYQQQPSQQQYQPNYFQQEQQIYN